MTKWENKPQSYVYERSLIQMYGEHRELKTTRIFNCANQSIKSLLRTLMKITVERHLCSNMLVWCPLLLAVLAE